MLELLSTSTTTNPATFIANTISGIDSNYSSSLSAEYTDFSYNSTTLPELSTFANKTLEDRCDPANYANISEFNCTVDEYLFMWLGAKTQPLDEAIWVTILFVGIFATGVIGNVIVCYVIIRNSSMHTATNYYLFSLAVSDLLFLIMGLPYDISLYWHQYPYSMGLTFCKMRALISEASTYVSVLTIVAFSMERFLAICHPLHLYTMSGLQRAIRIIAALWVISFLSAVPFAVFTKVHYRNYPKNNKEIEDSAFCAMLDNPDKFPLWEVSTCVFFAFPMVTMIVLYMRMGLKIRSRTRHTAALGVQQGSTHGESKHSQSRKAVIRMLAAVVITFFVCWAPFHAQRLLYLYGQGIESFKILNQWVFAVSGWLYYVSCTINPILYNVMSHRYRIAFRETLCSRKRGYYSSANGFVRDQSSFRETTIAAAGRDHNLNYEGSQLLRSKSTSSSYRSVRYKDNSRQSNSIRWKESSNSVKRVDSIKSNDSVRSTNSTTSNGSSSNVIVVTNGNGNGFKSKCVSMPNKLLSTSPSSFPRNETVKSKTSSTSSSTLQPLSPRSPSSKKNLQSTSSYEGERMNHLLEEDEDDEMSKEKITNKDENISIKDLNQTCSYSRGAAHFCNAIRNETCI